MIKPSDSDILALADYAHEWAQKHVDFDEFHVEINISTFHSKDTNLINTIDVAILTASSDLVLMNVALMTKAGIHRTFAIWRDLQLLVRFRPDSDIARDYARNFGPDAVDHDWHGGFTRLRDYVDAQLIKFPLPVDAP